MLSIIAILYLFKIKIKILPLNYFPKTLGASVKTDTFGHSTYEISLHGRMYYQGGHAY